MSGDMPLLDRIQKDMVEAMKAKDETQPEHRKNDEDRPEEARSRLDEAA